jgi:hypothetical protein
MPNPIERLRHVRFERVLQRKGRYVTPQLDPLRRTAAKHALVFIILLTTAESQGTAAALLTRKTPSRDSPRDAFYHELSIFICSEHRRLLYIKHILVAALFSSSLVDVPLAGRTWYF